MAKFVRARKYLDLSSTAGGLGCRREVPFTAFKTFQVPIAEIERLTGLVFTAGVNGATRLSKFDPLASASATRRQAIARAGVSTAEATTVRE
jgi:endonuclease G